MPMVNQTRIKIQIIVHAQILITVILKEMKLHIKIQYAAISFTKGKVNDS